MDRVSAKFFVSSIELSHPAVAGRTIKLRPGYPGDDASPEDSGELTMYVNNPPAADFLELGKSYYLDFTRADS